MSKRLLIICCHQPSLDPRIRWTAEFGVDNEFDTHVLGFNHKPADQSYNPATAAVGETVYTPSDAKHSNRYVLKQMFSHGILPRFWDFMLFILVGLILSPFILALAIFKSIKFGMRTVSRALSRIFGIIRYLPKGDAIYNLSGHALRRIYHLTLLPVFLLPSRILRFSWRKLTQGRFTATVEAFRGYHWYVFSHSMRFATCVLQRYAAGEGPPTVIHAHDPDALLAGVLLKKKYGARLIYDAHESGPDAYLIRPKPRYFFFAFERMLMKHVDAAVTVSPVLVEQFNARYKNRPAFHLLPNTSPKSDMGFRQPQNSDIKTLAKGRIAVLFQGGLAPQRGVEWIITEWEALNPDNAALFIRGPMNDYREKLLDATRQTGLLGTSIYFLESISEDDLTKAASAADIGIIPYHSHVENHIGACPNKLSQYMMAGLAILATPIPFVRTTLERAKCGYIYDDTIKGDFGRVIAPLLEAPEKCDSLGQLAKDASKTWFNFETYAESLHSLYTGET